ncbi:MAG: hypothetical protein LKF80_14945 [Brevundimonas sp.]|jgi:hypothetical protein|uniref:acyl-CoA dehydrogenase family protein n=1 Tax=Brevundimonas sp. TaxID=1871086 RepID=UPI0025C01211|nr:acyl-CoA dehydrogenase family protein [Brevundimonas sp.]MCH4269692.1 hypothetical protein [Brevundimonas sp.]
MTALLVDPYLRLLANLPEVDPWPQLSDSGFLDLLQGDEGGEVGLQDLFALAFETGRRPEAPPVIETIAARIFQPDALAVQDPEPVIGRPFAAAIAAALMAGAMAEIQVLTVEYATTRAQFGREIGRFQAIQQQMAVLAEEAAAARMAAQIGLSGVALEVSPTRAGVAKIRCNEAAARVTAIAHAVHGAIGMSHEYRLHCLTGRLRTWRMAHGGESWWAGQLGRLVMEDDRGLADLARQI